MSHVRQSSSKFPSQNGTLSFSAIQDLKKDEDQDVNLLRSKQSSPRQKTVDLLVTIDNDKHSSYFDRSVHDSELMQPFKPKKDLDKMRVV